MARYIAILTFSLLFCSSSLHAAIELPFYQNFIQWVISQQATFHRELVSLVRAISKEGSAALLWGLLSSSFFYGIFHAAGPGHGKAVISSYMLASHAPIKRGIGLSFLCAGVQALMAILIIVVLSQVFSLAGKAMQISRFLEIASFAAVGAIGIWMLTRLLKGQSSCGHDHSKDHLHSHHDHNEHHKHDHHEHGHTHTDNHSQHSNDKHACCAHQTHNCSHGVTSKEEGEGQQGENFNKETKIARQSIWAMVAAVGIRPCTGAVLVLLFSVTTGIFWWGVAAAFAMALGTAITVSSLAAASVFIRDTGFALSDKSSVWRQRLSRIFGFVAAFTLIIVSCSMVWGYLGTTGRAF